MSWSPNRARTSKATASGAAWGSSSSSASASAPSSAPASSSASPTPSPRPAPPSSSPSSWRPITCVFTAFSFAELGGAIPVSGSSYSYAYATLGERTAFLVGWCLLLEYGISVSAVAVGWGQYLNELLGSLTGWQLPAALSAAAR